MELLLLRLRRTLSRQVFLLFHLVQFDLRLVVVNDSLINSPSNEFLLATVVQSKTLSRSFDLTQFHLSLTETFSQSLSLLSTPSHLLMINSIFDEARQLKLQIGQVITMSALLPLLERLLELVGSIANRIRGTMEVEAISQATECLDYAWNASKTAIIRWEELKGRSIHDNSLNAIQFVYGTLPIFASWEQRKHLELLENVVLLCLNTVKNWQPPPSSRESALLFINHH